MSILKQYTLSAAVDIESFDPATFANSGLIYNGEKFVAWKSGDAFDADSYYTTTWIDALSGSIDTRLDTLEGYDEFDHELYSLSANLYNQTWIDALSGSIDTRLDTLEGYDEFDHELYSLSANLYNRTWIDALSGSIDTRIDALEAVSDTPDNWGTLTEGTGIAPITSVGISGSGDHDITVLGYATISGQAKQAYDHSSNSDLHRVNARGWAAVADGGTIAHGLGALPVTAYVMPSGTDVFATSIKLDATNITVYHTSPNEQTVSWRAEL